VLLCDADNLADYQSYIHKHPHELLDSVVKERFDQVFRLNRGRAFYSSLVTCQAVFEEVFLSSQPLALPINLASLFSGRRIIQRSKPLSTTSFQPLPINPTEATNRAEPPPCQPGAFYSNPPPVQPFYLANLLIYKRFYLRTAPEVVRIIGA
jgi:hypothetical protein